MQFLPRVVACYYHCRRTLRIGPIKRAQISLSWISMLLLISMPTDSVQRCYKEKTKEQKMKNAPEETRKSTIIVFGC